MECRHAQNSDLETVCDLLMTEFYNDPVLRYVFTGTEKEQRMKSMRGFFRIYVNLAQTHGGIFISENNAGTLVYFGPELMEMSAEDNALIDSQLRQECADDYHTVSAFMKGLDHHHPRTPRHYYIFLVAVSRSERGGGLFANLLQELNSILVKENLPCYAECTTFNTRTLARRFGWRDAGAPLLIDGFPKLYPLWCQPQ